MDSHLSNLIAKRDELRELLAGWDNMPPSGLVERLNELDKKIERLQRCEEQ